MISMFALLLTIRSTKGYRNIDFVVIKSAASFRSPPFFPSCHQDLCIPDVQYKGVKRRETTRKRITFFSVSPFLLPLSLFLSHKEKQECGCEIIKRKGERIYVLSVPGAFYRLNISLGCGDRRSLLFLSLPVSRPKKSPRSIEPIFYRTQRA